MRSMTICVGRLTLAAEPARAQLSRFYQDSTCDVKCVTSHTGPSPSLCNSGRGLRTRLVHMCFMPFLPLFQEAVDTLYLVVCKLAVKGDALHEGLLYIVHSCYSRSHFISVDGSSVRVCFESYFQFAQYSLP